MTQENGLYLLKVPGRWKQIYTTLLTLMANNGLKLLEDCNASCTGTGRQLISCWNMFNVACACYELENISEANAMLKTVIYQLNLTFNLNLDYETINSIEPLATIYWKNNIDVFDERNTTFKALYDYYVSEHFDATVKGFYDYLINEYIGEYDVNYYNPISSKSTFGYIFAEDDLYFEIHQNGNSLVLYIPIDYKLSKLWCEDNGNNSIYYSESDNIDESIINETYVFNNIDYNVYQFYFSGKINNNLKVQLS